MMHSMDMDTGHDEAHRGTEELSLQSVTTTKTG